MVTPTYLKTDTPVLVRMAAAEREVLWALLFSRYPTCEWGSFLRLGFRETRRGLVLTVQGIDAPLKGDFDEDLSHVGIQPSYIKRVLRAAEQHPYALGFVHSHPEGYGTVPSDLDYDMEEYLADLQKEYTQDRPFVSLIFSRFGDQLSGSGRVYWKGQLYTVERFVLEGPEVALYDYELPPALSEVSLRRVARLASAFSEKAAHALARARIGVVGASGTGSPILELLARAGVGHIVVVDGDQFSDSNLERVHGSEARDVDAAPPKSLLAQRHIHAINPDCTVTAIEGRIPQTEVVDELLWCDLVLGCTDTQSARVALSDTSLRYLMPLIDVGVCLEGGDGKITSQVMQMNRLFPSDPCMHCRGLIDYRIVAQELLPEAEQAQRKAAAGAAGADPNAYWVDMPQLNTVGYLTTLAGSLVSCLVTGYLTGTFEQPYNRIELSLTRKGISVLERKEVQQAHCSCAQFRGVADQQPMAVQLSAPDHWPPPVVHIDKKEASALQESFAAATEN